MKKRESIINYMLELTEQFSLHLSTCFVAISFYDRIFHEFSTDVKTQGKVGIVCLLVAGALCCPPLSCSKVRGEGGKHPIIFLLLQPVLLLVQDRGGDLALRDQRC